MPFRLLAIYKFFMKKIILFLSIVIGMTSCNSSEKAQKERISTKKNAEMKVSDTSPNEADIKWINMGYDLEKGRPEGLKVGMQAPDFQLKSPNGQLVRLSDELKKQPVVLIFYRGQWCPGLHSLSIWFSREFAED